MCYTVRIVTYTMDEAQKAFLLSKLQDISKRQRVVAITSDGITHHGKIEQIQNQWIELLHDQKIVLVNLSTISALSYSL